MGAVAAPGEQRGDISIRESDERCRALLEYLADPVLILGRDGALLWSSDAFRRCGLVDADQDTLHPGIFGPVHPDDSGRWRETLATAAAQNGQSQKLPAVRLIALDGSEHYFDLTVTHCPDVPGIRGTLVALHDVTEHQRALEAVHSSGRQYRDLVESAQDAIFSADADGRYIYANRAAAANIGTTPEAVIGKTVDDFFPPHLARQYRAEIQDVINGGKSITRDGSLQRDGQTKLFSVIGQPIRDAQGRITSVQHIARDITALKLTERALRENEERLQQAVSLSHIGIFDHDLLTGSVYCSPEQRQIYGLRPDESLEMGESLARLIHPDDRERVAAAAARAHAGPDGLYELEHRIIRRDGQERWIYVRSQTFFQGEGRARRAVRTVGANQDITERKHVDRELRLLHAAIESSRIAFYRISSKGQIAYVNEEASRSLGLTREQLLGRYIWDIDPDFPAGAQEDYWQQIRRARMMHFESRHRRADGALIPVEIIVSYFAYQGEEYSLAFAQDITERKRAEHRLQLTQTALDRCSTAIFWLGIGGDITYANDRACQSLGLTLEELTGRHVWEFDPDFLAERWPPYIVELRQRKSFAIETRHRRKDGSVFPVEVLGNYVQIEGEEQLLAFVHDISDRRRAEEAAQRFQLSIDRAADAVFWINSAGGFDFVNDAACKTLGYSRDELLRRKLWDINPSVKPEQWTSDWEQWEALGRDSSDPRQTVHRRRDGTLIPVEVIGQHIWAPDGQSLHIGYARDITERKRAEQALRDSDERLRQVALVYAIGVFEHNHLTDELYWSPEMYRLWGLPIGSPLSFSTLSPRIHAEDLPRIDAAALASHDPASDGRYAAQMRIHRTDGAIRWIDSRSQTFFEGQGAARRPTRTVGAMVDITDRVTSEEALRQSLQEKETLLREVHHRVKNNLQIIASLLHFQAKQIRDPADLDAFAEGRDRLRSMILVHEKLYQSRDLSRIDFGGYLQALVRDLQHSYASSSARIKVRVITQQLDLPIKSALPCGMILCELLTNVFKYAFPAGRQGEALVAVSVDDGHIRMSVKDDGVGLPEDFDPERSASFGWQLIRNLTAQLGGTVTIERARGTRVSVAFANEQAAA